MKAIGVVARIDKQGRVWLTKPIRVYFDLWPNQPMEMFIDGENIILTKYKPSCVFCGGRNDDDEEDLVEMDHKFVCERCINALRRFAK